MQAVLMLTMLAGADPVKLPDPAELGGRVAAVEKELAAVKKELAVVKGQLAAPAKAALAPPKCDDCGAACDCKDCGCRASTDAEKDRYAGLLAAVSRGGRAVMAVGVSVSTAEYPQYKFGAGFRGQADGVYDCFLGADGVPMMRLRRAAPAPASCAGGSCGSWRSCPSGQCGR